MTIDSDQAAVLDHAFRYRMVVAEVLVETATFSEWRLRRVKKLLRSLEEDDGLLASAPLYGTRSYCFLTEQGVSVHRPDIPQADREKLARHLPETEKPRLYGTLSFCCLSKTLRERLTLDEFKRHFPNHYRPRLQVNYYVIHEAKRLGYVHVDTGSRGRWDRLLGGLKRRIQRHRRIPAFAQLIQENRFELAVVVAFPEKAERLSAPLQQLAESEGVGIHLRLVPDLIHLIAPPPVSE